MGTSIRCLVLVFATQNRPDNTCRVPAGGACVHTPPPQIQDNNMKGRQPSRDDVGVAPRGMGWERATRDDEEIRRKRASVRGNSKVMSLFPRPKLIVSRVPNTWHGAVSSFDVILRCTFFSMTNSIPYKSRYGTTLTACACRW